MGSYQILAKLNIRNTAINLVWNMWKFFAKDQKLHYIALLDHKSKNSIAYVSVAL